VLSPADATCGAGAWAPFAGVHASTVRAAVKTTMRIAGRASAEREDR
jgi:hypothetical protein